MNFEVRWGGGREPRILFLSGDVDIPWSSVMRRVFEHGLHGLHGLFLGTRVFLVNAWCVGFLNTDFTDYTDVFIGGRQDWRLWSHCEEAQNYP